MQRESKGVGSYKVRRNMEPSETRNSPQGGHSSALELIRLTLPGLRRISNLKERGQLLSNPQGSPLFVAPRPGCTAGQ